MPAAATPEIFVEKGVTVIALGPDFATLDDSHLQSLRTVVLDVSQRADPPLVVIDLSHTRFFGSAFIEVLFRLWNRLNSRTDGAFAISGLTPYCAEVLKVTHLDKLWDLFPTRDEAVAHLSERTRTGS